ncbi:MAG TPA: thioesterase family protein [Bdellovibrionales bacterium]|nr:thioesterase family protein [Bdellovibrionales bacterium]
MAPRFSYQRRVAFGDTDAMGVTHHANYLHFCEEARVHWMREKGLSKTHFPQSDRVLAVLQYGMKHLKPSTFEDLLRVELQVRRIGLKIHFQYAIYKDDVRIAEAETLHIPVDKELRPTRPNPEFLTRLEHETWIETWLSSSFVSPRPPP